jgi:ribosomal protein S6
MARNEQTEGEDLAMDADHSEARVYELGFHIDPELPQEEVKKTYGSIREYIAANGTIVAEGEPQKVPLAYTISRSETTGRRDFNTAYFAWIAYEADGAGHQAVSDMAKGEAKIIRFIDLRTTKEAAQHAAEMHEIYAKMTQEEGGEEAPEEVLDQELDAALKEAGV